MNNSRPMTNSSQDINFLVIDDEAFVLNVTVKALQQLGHERIDTASNGLEALNMLSESTSPYDVIICDLNMPQMDGIEFIHHAKQRNYGGGLILLSGEDRRILEMTRNLATTQDLNILGSITKPVSLPLLEDILCQYTPNISDLQNDEQQQALDEEELIAAIEGECNELLLFYQPIAHIRSGDITAVQTVPKWQHTSRGTLEPHTFLPLAEQCGVAEKLTLKIYDKAIKQAAEWKSSGIFLQNFIGVSPNSLTDKHLVEFLLEKPQEMGIVHKHMNLVFTERQLESNSIDITEILMRFHFRKIGIAIDDFSMSDVIMESIKVFPYSKLGIDRNLLNSPDNEAKLKSVMGANNGLAKSLNTEISIHNIQTAEDWNFAEELGFDYAQGNFCSKPLANRGLLEFIENWSPPPRRIQ